MIVKNTMRYALRNQDKIVTALGEEYLRKHIIASLDDFFRTASKNTFDRSIRIAVTTTDDESEIIEREYLCINDAMDGNVTQEFVILGRNWDVVRLAYVGQSKL